MVTCLAYTPNQACAFEGKEVFRMAVVKKAKAAPARKARKAPAKKTGKGRA